MNELRRKLGTSPILPRVVPFCIYLAVTYGQGRLGIESNFWCYALKTFLAAWLVWITWPLVAEMRWRFSVEAVLVGLFVFAFWVGLDGWYPRLDKYFSKGPHPDFLWNPHTIYGQNSLAAWFFIVVRIVGSTLVVPPLEEVFYRSFLWRYIAKQDFLSVPLKTFLPMPFIVTAVMFGVSHQEWLAGILCGMVYHGLVLWKGRLGDAMTAHAITNFVLGLWIVWKGAWQFW